MSSDNIKQLYNLRENDPQKAIELARVPGPGPGEREAAAVVLVDCGDAVGDFASVSQGVEIFNELVESGGSDAALSYNLANALQVRARLAYGPVSPISGQAFEDRFRARVRFGEVLRDGIASPELKSQALTNIGILLLDTSRWVEGLDCFQRALEALPRNGVAAYQEMRHSMGLAGLFHRQHETYQTYCHIDTLLQRIRRLSDVVFSNQDVIIDFSGRDVLRTVIDAANDAAKIESVPRKAIENRYFSFIDAEGLALSLCCSVEEYEAGRFDLLTIPSIRAKESDEHCVPEVFAMINVMKSDYAFARQVYYDVREYDVETPYLETTSHADTLDYAVYGVRYSALTSAQRIAFDLLDKIAVALACYLGLKKAYKSSFADVWGRTGKGGIFQLHDEISAHLRAGNPGLIALFNIYHDISKDESRGDGFMQAHKSYRNSSTHRFSVFHDDMFSEDTSSASLAVDHTHLNRFDRLTLDSLKLARAALFYFVDTINFAEGAHRDREGAIVLSSKVPDHDYIRGR